VYGAPPLPQEPSKTRTGVLPKRGRRAPKNRGRVPKTQQALLPATPPPSTSAHRPTFPTNTCKEATRHLPRSYQAPAAPRTPRMRSLRAVPALPRTPLPGATKSLHTPPQVCLHHHRR
jgi:hypothetical protein